MSKFLHGQGNPLGPIIFLLVAGLFLAALASCTSNSNNPVASPTRTAQPTRTPTRVILPTRTQRPVSLRACVTNETIRIRKGPGTEYEAIDGMVSGTCMSILGRNRDSSWAYMVSEDDKTGWVAAWLLTIEGDITQVSERSGSQTLSLASTQKVLPTQKLPPTPTRKPTVFFTSTPRPVISIMPCSEADSHIGETVVCKIEKAYCDYRPDVDGSPTFCNDRPYPNQNFALVTFDRDWSDYNGSCILVSGRVYMYGGVPQIEGVSRSQVSYCQ